MLEKNKREQNNTPRTDFEPSIPPQVVGAAPGASPQVSPWNDLELRSPLGAEVFHQQDTRGVMRRSIKDERSERYQGVVSAIQLSSPAQMFEWKLESPHAARLDLSLTNPLVASTDCRDNKDVTRLVETVLREAGAKIGIGGYNEKRGWYARGEQFAEGAEIRSIHLGVDVCAPAGTKVYAPYDAVIHSVQDNNQFGDYGPTIILTHTLGSETFHTLYGHLSRESLVGKSAGMRVSQGDELAQFGAPPINGDWPPHLHFQIIIDMLGKFGDYPGVAAESQRDYFITLCPDPNLILRSSQL